MTKAETARLLAVISVAYPGKFKLESATEAAGVWQELVGDLEYANANAALRVLLQTSQWPPTPADLRKAALELARGPGRTGAEAWGDVLAAVSGFGAYRSPGSDFAFTDPCVALVVGALGWQNLCLSENQAADRARFIEAYEVIASQDRKEAQSPILAAAREQRAVTAGEAITGVLRLLERSRS